MGTPGHQQLTPIGEGESNIPEESIRPIKICTLVHSIRAIQRAVPHTRTALQVDATVTVYRNSVAKLTCVVIGSLCNRRVFASLKDITIVLVYIIKKKVVVCATLTFTEGK